MYQLKARAKINLFFHLTGKRADGYHLVESLVVFAQDLYDSITITPAAANTTSIDGGEFAHLLTGSNLIDRSLSTFAGQGKYHCSLRKDIPIGAGLGGGSSDAAMVAKFLVPDAITEQLATIGADLPVCFHNQATFCRGIGEIIEPVTDFPTLYMVLVNPRKQLLTADVFKHNRNISTPSLSSKPTSFSSPQGVIDFLSPLTNDLTDASIAIMPEIQTILTLIAAQDGCHTARMSGSGPTCFGLFIEQAAALEASKNISNSHPELWVKYSEVN